MAGAAGALARVGAVALPLGTEQLQLPEAAGVHVPVHVAARGAASAHGREAAAEPGAGKGSLVAAGAAA